MSRLLLIISLFASLIAVSQIPIMQWQQCHGTEDLDRSFAVSYGESGYLIAVEVRSGNDLTNYHGLDEIWILQIDSIGETIWEKCFGGSDHDTPRKIVRRNSNEFYVLAGTRSTDGDIQSFNHGDSDIWVIKINEEGDLLWEKCYGSPGTDEPRDLILTPDGGFVVLSRISYAGGDISQYFGLYDNWIVKCDSLGNIEWEKTLGNEGLDNCISMIINSEDNIMMIGAAQKHGGLVECFPDEVWGDVWLVELDLQGNIISQHCYGGSEYELGYYIQEKEDGYYFIGSTYSNDGDVSGLHGSPGGPPDGWGDIWVVRLNEQMEIVWQKCLGGFRSDSPSYFSQTSDEGLVIIGMTDSNNGDVSGNHSMSGTYYSDVWVVKLNSSGEIEWQHCYGGWGGEQLENPHTILKKGDYNYVIASSTNISPSYDVQCGSIGGTNRDAWIFEIDLEDTTNVVEQSESNQPVKVYPNPAKDYVEFEVGGLRFEGNSTINIFDIFGQEVARKEITSEKTVFDLRQWKEGIYFYCMEMEGHHYSGKFVVQR